jgi:hypothetical protein
VYTPQSLWYSLKIFDWLERNTENTQNCTVIFMLEENHRSIKQQIQKVGQKNAMQTRSSSGMHGTLFPFGDILTNLPKLI